MIIILDVVFALVLFKKSTLNFNVVDHLATISIPYSCSLVNFSNTYYSHNRLFMIKHYELDIILSVDLLCF